VSDVSIFFVLNDLVPELLSYGVAFTVAPAPIDEDSSFVKGTVVASYNYRFINISDNVLFNFVQLVTNIYLSFSYVEYLIDFIKFFEED